MALAERLREEGVEVEFVGTRQGVEADVVPRHGFPIRFVQAGRFSRKPVQFMRGLLETAVGFVQCLGWLLLRRPGLIVGTGGYASAPVGLAGAVLRIPLLVLEQNAVPGKVTRLLSRFARHVCVSFPETLRWLPEGRSEVTGNPIRPEILACSREEGRRKLGLDLARPCLLITGASQGANSLNRAVLGALPRWSRQPWSVVHLTGPKGFEEVAQAAAGLTREGNLAYRALGYLDDMAAAYAAADLVVSRSGATTLAELTARGLPAVLVPYPFAAEDHQRKNARPLVEAGAAVMVEDEAVEEQLAGVVEELLDDTGRLSEMAAASRGLGRPQATDRILQLVHRLQGSGRKERS